MINLEDKLNNLSVGETYNHVISIPILYITKLPNGYVINGTIYLSNAEMHTTDKIQAIDVDSRESTDIEIKSFLADNKDKPSIKIINLSTTDALDDIVVFSAKVTPNYGLNEGFLFSNGIHEIHIDEINDNPANIHPINFNKLLNGKVLTKDAIINSDWKIVSTGQD